MAKSKREDSDQAETVDPEEHTDIPHPHVEGHGDSSGNPDNKPRPKPL